MSDTVRSKEGESLPPHVLILRLQLDPWKLSIGGSERNIDIALAILRQAVTFFEEQSLHRSDDERQKAAYEAMQKSGEADHVRSLIDKGMTRGKPQ